MIWWYFVRLSAAAMRIDRGQDILSGAQRGRLGRCRRCAPLRCHQLALFQLKIDEVVAKSAIAKSKLNNFFPLLVCHDSVLLHRTMLGRVLALSWHCPVPEHAPVLSCPASRLGRVRERQSEEAERDKQSETGRARQAEPDKQSQTASARQRRLRD